MTVLFYVGLVMLIVSTITFGMASDTESKYLSRHPHKIPEVTSRTVAKLYGFGGAVFLTGLATVIATGIVILVSA